MARLSPNLEKSLRSKPNNETLSATVQQGLPLPTHELNASINPTQHWTAVCFILSELRKTQSTTSLRSWKAWKALRGHCLPCLVSMLVGRCRLGFPLLVFSILFHLAPPSGCQFRLMVQKQSMLFIMTQVELVWKNIIPHTKQNQSFRDFNFKIVRKDVFLMLII